MDRKPYLDAIDRAIAELIPISRRTAAPASNQAQYIGTVVDNTIAMLCSPANALDLRGRQVAFERELNWKSLMQAVHRSFYSSIHLASEAGLREVCTARGYTISSPRDRAELLCNSIGDRLSARERREILALAGRIPTFSDYLNAVLAGSGLKKARKKDWRKFYDALSVARNKVSHSDTTLSEKERSRLNDGGLGILVTETGVFVTNPRHYAQLCQTVLEFYRELGLE